MKKKFKNLAMGSMIAALIAVTGCGTSSASSSSPNKSSTTQKAETANVAYAGSLQFVNDEFTGPAFTKESGIPYQGRGGGAFGVANLIKNGEITPSVFESMGTAPYDQMGSKQPDWAIGFASAPLVIAYSPSSPYASEFKDIANGKLPLSDLFTLME